MSDRATVDESDECEEQRQRRASIKAIMGDESLTPLERRRSIQALMDGRRRSSIASRGSLRSSQRGSSSGGLTGMAAAAAAAALEYDSSDDEDGPGGQPMVHNASLNVHVSQGSAGLPNTMSSAANYRRRSWASVASTADGSEEDGECGGSVASGATGSSQNPDPDVIFAQHSIAMMAAVAYHENPGSQKVMELSKRMEQQRPECTHYDRNCTLIAACCGMAFGCRICHDDMALLPPPVYDIEREKKAKAVLEAAKKVEADHLPRTKRSMERSSSVPNISSNYDENVPEHHNIDRFATTEVICRICFYRQGSKTNNCRNCGVTFGAYHCNICNLWMSAEENPYHCVECGFCRVGGKENFKHCFDCGMCIDAFLFNDHNCKVGKYMSNCPVCQEDLFSSRSASHEMPCGHAIHWHCFRELTSFDSRCPVCKKTAESHERMAPTWSAMAMGIALQPVPPELARVVTISCTDCEVREANRRWHFLGVQCRHCTSFNTVVEETTMTGPEAAAFLGEHEGSEDARAVLTAAMEAAREIGDLDIARMGVQGTYDDGDEAMGH